VGHVAQAIGAGGGTDGSAVAAVDVDVGDVGYVEVDDDEQAAAVRVSTPSTTPSSARAVDRRGVRRGRERGIGAERTSVAGPAPGPFRDLGERNGPAPPRVGAT